jgi:serine/threonine protein kinase
VIGSKLSHYRILDRLGSGGMGEVYLAEDTRLRRRLALKVLAPGMSSDPDLLRRFEREAEAVAALNHPNIVTIYSVGEEDDVAFITMELVRGQTLRQLMASRMLLRTVLDVSVQLASALSAAHAIGIVHRDLKPENIMVTPEGLVKVLDFGIARRDGAPDDSGTTVGTLGYMSPEQAVGQPAGPASDQFAIGAILYELLTGRQAFHGESRSETLAAILPSTSSALRRSLRSSAPVRATCCSTAREPTRISASRRSPAILATATSSGRRPSGISRWRPASSTTARSKTWGTPFAST